MSDMDLAKLMQEDDLGKDAGVLIQELRCACTTQTQQQ
jgi:hypothetical protein